jgi:hypothetical protein
MLVLAITSPPQLVARDSFFHFFGEGAAAGAGVRAVSGEEGEKGAAVMDEDAQVDAVTVVMMAAAVVMMVMMAAAMVMMAMKAAAMVMVTMMVSCDCSP